MRLCKECGQPMLRRGQRRKHPDDYRHASGCPLDDMPDECIADDITECDCSRCTSADLAHEHVNGGHGTDDPDSDEDGCPECERELAEALGPT